MSILTKMWKTQSVAVNHHRSQIGFNKKFLLSIVLKYQTHTTVEDRRPQLIFVHYHRYGIADMTHYFFFTFRLIISEASVFVHFINSFIYLV